jgi:integrase
MTENTISTQFLFTKKAIEQLPPNPLESASKEKEYSDTQTVGLKVLVNKRGRKFFYFRYTIHKRKRGIKVGEFPALSLADARQRCNELRAQIDKGVDPQQEKQEQRQIPTFAEFVQGSYLPFAYANKKSACSDESKLRVHLLNLFGHQKLDQITTQQIQRYIDGLKTRYTPATANRHLSLLSRMFKLAITWGFISGKNPAAGIPKAQENNQRKRYLSHDEIARYMAALEAEPNRVAAAYLAFLLYTGVRKTEALMAKWEHVDLISRTWFLPETKNGKSRHVLLNSKAVELLQNQPRLPGNPYVFPGKIAGKPLNNPQKAFSRALKKAKIENFTIHCLRHTTASIAINSGATLYEVKDLLGHSQVVTTMRYAHLADETLRRVSDNVADAIANAVG